MPVIDTEVHPLVRQEPGARYGCNGKPRRRDMLLVKAGYTSAPGNLFAMVRKQIWHRVPDNGSKECRYDRSLGDPKCEGCQHRGSGQEYSKSVQMAAMENQNG